MKIVFLIIPHLRLRLMSVASKLCEEDIVGEIIDHLPDEYLDDQTLATIEDIGIQRDIRWMLSVWCSRGMWQIVLSDHHGAWLVLRIQCVESTWNRDRSVSWILNNNLPFSEWMNEQIATSELHQICWTRHRISHHRIGNWKKVIPKRRISRAIQNEYGILGHRPVWMWIWGSFKITRMPCVVVASKVSPLSFIHQTNCHKSTSSFCMCHLAKPSYLRLNRRRLNHKKRFRHTIPISGIAITIANENWNSFENTRSTIVNWSVYPISHWGAVDAWNFRCHVRFDLINFIGSIKWENDRKNDHFQA